MEWLENLLKENGIEKTEDIVESFKKEFPNHAVPKEQYNKKVYKIEEIESELNSANKQLEQTNDQIDKLKGDAEGKEEIKKQLESIQAEYNEYKESEQDRINSIKKRSVLEKELLTSNVPEDAVDLLISDFNIDDMELDEEGNIKNLNDHKEKVKQKRPSLFGKEKIKGHKPTDGDSEETVIDMDNIDNMTEEQINKNWDKISEQLSKGK